MTKNELLAYIQDDVKRTGKFPFVADIATHFKIPKYRISMLLKQLVKKGALLRVNNWFRLPEQQVAQTEFETSLNLEQKEAAPIVTNSDSLRIFGHFSYKTLSWILFAIGIGAAIMSAYFTKIYLAESMNEFFAWLLGILMVSFSVIVFGLIALLVSGAIIKHWSRYLLIILFSILWFVCSGFSMVSTIAGQYNQNQINMEIKVVRENKITVDKSLLSMEEKLQDDLVSSRNDARKRLSGLLEASAIALRDPKAIRESWSSIQDRIVATRKEISGLDSKIETSRDKMRKLLAENPSAQSGIKEENNFIDWVAKIFGGNSALIQFWFSVFPAIFLDIISPVVLTIFIFLQKNRKK